MTQWIIEKGTPGFSAGKKRTNWACVASETTNWFSTTAAFTKARYSAKRLIVIQSMAVLDGGHFDRRPLWASPKAPLLLLFGHARTPSIWKTHFQFRAISFKLVLIWQRRYRHRIKLTRQAGRMKDQGKRRRKYLHYQILCFRNYSAVVANGNY